MSYYKEVDNIIKSSIFSNPANFTKSDIFNFSDLPNEELYEQFYNFCRTNMDIHAEKLNINPNYFVFINDIRSNAQAVRIKGEYFMLINMGLVQSSIDNLLQNEELNKFFNKRFPDLISKYDNSIAGLGFQVATQFAYYHELAHLIQFSKQGERYKSLQEMYSTSPGFNMEQHKLEINADTYAAFAITNHIQDYLEKTFTDDLSEEKVKDTFVLISVCLLNHIARFATINVDLYFDKSSHPHPYLRLFNVILNIAHYLNSTHYFQENNIKIFAASTLKEIFDLYQDLEKENIFTTNFGKSLDEAEKFQDKIVEYLGELINFDIEKNYYDALEKWNKVFE